MQVAGDTGTDLFCGYRDVGGLVCVREDGIWSFRLLGVQASSWPAGAGQDQRWTRTHRAAASHAAVRNLSSHTDIHTHAGSTLHNPLTLWTFDIRVNACQVPAMCTRFGVDSSTRFPFGARIHTQTKSQTPLITLPTPAWVTTVLVVLPTVQVFIYRGYSHSSRHSSLRWCISIWSWNSENVRQ